MSKELEVTQRQTAKPAEQSVEWTLRPSAKGGEDLATTRDRLEKCQSNLTMTQALVAQVLDRKEESHSFQIHALLDVGVFLLGVIGLGWLAAGMLQKLWRR